MRITWDFLRCSSILSIQIQIRSIHFLDFSGRDEERYFAEGVSQEEPELGEVHHTQKGTSRRLKLDFNNSGSDGALSGEVDALLLGEIQLAKKNKSDPRYSNKLNNQIKIAMWPHVTLLGGAIKFGKKSIPITTDNIDSYFKFRESFRRLRKLQTQTIMGNYIVEPGN